MLNHSTLLIRRAEDWKTRGIPEYQELSNAAAQLLSQLKDSSNPETAIKQVILQTRNLNLNGEYKEPMKLICDVLHLYYPASGSANKIKSTGETELLILLGEQYAGLGASAKNEQEKIKALSSAAIWIKWTSVAASSCGISPIKKWLFRWVSLWILGQECRTIKENSIKVS